MTTRRNLTPAEISALHDRGCTAEDWSLIRVPERFDPSRLLHVHLMGEISLGECEKTVDLSGGVIKKSGIRYSTLRNCRIGDEVLIENVRLLSSYEIGSGAVLQNIGSLAVEGETKFGNGVELEVMNEGGGRELVIYDRLTAQIAYMMVFNRHRPELIQRLKELILRYTRSKQSGVGVVGENSRICNVAQIINVHVDPYTEISGAQLLYNGTIRSESTDPTVLGAGVIARDFIILEGSRITDAALLTNCFVGQGVRIGRGFSGEHSAFFANSEAFHSEGVALFAGPYTVTHHKSTLLIAGLYSFYNAGSGTNQSNHMYKLGPVHQGILERGSKTGSFSYLLWPSRIGPFSVVIGKHYTNLDLDTLPFSYIDEQNGKSLVTPGMNLFTVGTLRDANKWPNRDRRQGSEKLDLIHFHLFNPYTAGKMLKGLHALSELYENTSKDEEYVSYNGASIKRLMLKMGQKYYHIGLHVYFGSVIADKLASLGGEFTLGDIRDQLTTANTVEDDTWIDHAGFLARQARLEGLMDAVTSGELDTIEDLRSSLQTIFEHYSDDEWLWVITKAEPFYGVQFSDISIDQLVELLTAWRENTRKFHNMILKDAQKEFAPFARIGYGIDHPDEVEADFQAVRGSAETNSFIKNLQAESDRVKEQAAQLLQRVKALA